MSDTCWDKNFDKSSLENTIVIKSCERIIKTVFVTVFGFMRK